MTTIIGQLLEELAEVEQRLEISDKTMYNECNEGDDEIFLPPDEYKRVMAALETWLKSNPQFKKQKYLNKGIQFNSCGFPSGLSTNT